MQFKHRKAIAEFFVDMSVIFTILALSQIAWCLLEILLDGGIQPSYSDSIIGAILCISIRRNLRWKFEYKEAGTHCDT